jgi:LAO/AO transport system kinase
MEVQAAPPASHDLWIPPIRRTVSTEGKGIAELVQSIETHRQRLLESGEWQQREAARLAAELDLLVQNALVARWRASLQPGEYQRVLEDMLARRVSPWQALDALLD